MIKATELLVNPDGSIFHLHLHSGEIADTIILVGDPGRVKAVGKFLRNIEVDIQNREFYTITGYYKQNRISVISTGIGVSNVDIVMNELDALANINFNTKQVNPQLQQLNLIRLGTTGALQEHIHPGSYILSKHAIGLDNLSDFTDGEHYLNKALTDALKSYYPNLFQLTNPYASNASDKLNDILISDKIIEGITLTAPGFYAAQNRTLRIPVKEKQMIDKLSAFTYDGLQITNLEMESSALFHYAHMLGHEATTICLTLANRVTQQVLTGYHQNMDNLIVHLLEKLLGIK